MSEEMGVANTFKTSQLWGENVALSNEEDVLSRILNQIELHPRSVSILHGTVELSYGALGGHASEVSQRVRAAGVGPGDLVPIVTHGGLALPVAVVAIMMTGAAFVPVDAAWPHERIAAVLARLAPRVVLGEAAALTAIGGLPYPALELRIGAAAPAPQPMAEPFSPQDTAYGFFTSGTTGTPKCCLNTHRGLLNRFDYMSRQFGLQPGERVLQNSQHAFDSSLWQLIWPLTVGACVVIPERSSILDLDATLRSISENRVVMTDFVPSIFNLMVRLFETEPQKAASLAPMRHMIIGGEDANPALVADFRRRLPQITVTNTYGPTECAIGLVFHEVGDGDSAVIPLGRPIQNTFAMVVDKDLNPLPRNEVGEIAVGGDCLGAGYLGEREKTEAAFRDYAGGRLYLTGDLGHVDDAGLLHFNGRTDFQVKVGGVRVELGEVVSAFLALPQIKDAVVVPATRADGSTYLAGFVIPVGEADIAGLRASLAKTLPAASLPSRIEVCDAFPLNSNGKTDRAALIASLVAQAPSDAGNMSLVGKLVALWRRHLQAGAATQDTHFFDAGGDSLAAMSLVLSLPVEIGKSASIRMIYAHPTPRKLAAHLTEPAVEARTSQPTAADIEADIEAACAAFADGLQGRAVPGSLGEVLLTGATGFVGAHLLAELLTRTSRRIRCLVRASSDEEAMLRLRAGLERYQLGPAAPERLVPVAGDLAKTCFGLTEDRFAGLGAGLAYVLHAGAEVDFLKPYTALKPANVQGTAEVLRLAVHGGAPVHYLSTLSVLPGGARPQAETTLPAPLDLGGDVYSQTKAVGEMMCARASAAGLPTSIYRIGEAMPSAVSGVPNPTALLTYLLDGMRMMEQSVRLPIRFDYSPVDTLARIIVGAAEAQLGLPSPVHLFSPHTVALGEVLDLMDPQGRHFAAVAYPEFHAALTRRCQGDPSALCLVRLAALLPAPAEVTGWCTAEFQDPAVQFERRQAGALEASLGLGWPTIDAALIAKYAARFDPVHARRADAFANAPAA